jgi:O-antigen ligase
VRVAAIVVIVLVAAGLILLQIAIAGHGLLSALPSYALFGLAAVIGAIFWRSTGRIDRSCLIATILFAAWIVARALTSPANYMARHDLYAVLAAAVLYGLIVTIVDLPARRFALLLVLLVFAICHVILGLVQYGHGENLKFFSVMEGLPVTKRAAGFYLNPDHLAGLLELLGILALSVACWSRLRKWVRVIFGYLALNCYVGVALTASRGGYVGVVVSLIVFGILSLYVLRGGGVSILARYGVIGLLILSATLIIPALMLHRDDSLRDRVNNIASIDNTRVDLWRAAVRQWQLAPVLGTGAQTYRYYGRMLREPRMQLDPVWAHNDYLQLLAEYGLVGAALFAFFCWAHLRNGWRNFLYFGPQRLAGGNAPNSGRLALNIGALSALGAYAFHSAVDFNMHNPPNAMIIAIVFGFLANPGGRADELNSSEQKMSILRWSLCLLGAALLVQSARLLPGEYFSERANTALENEHPEEAKTFAEHALKFEQRNPDIFFCLGRAEEALRDLAVGAIDPNRPRASAEMADSHYETALRMFERARALAPLEEGSPLDLGWLYDQLGRHEEAEWMFDIAHRLDPHLKAIDGLYQTHLETWRNAAR